MAASRPKGIPFLGLGTYQGHSALEPEAPVCGENRARRSSHAKGPADRRRHRAMRDAQRVPRYRGLRGRRGAARAREGGWDLLVLDLMMPGMNGFDVLRALRPDVKTPVLMLTARGEATDTVVGLELGADDYVAKPASPRVLAARLRALLRRGGVQGPGPRSVGDLIMDPASRSGPDGRRPGRSRGGPGVAACSAGERGAQCRASHRRGYQGGGSPGAGRRRARGDGARLG